MVRQIDAARTCPTLAARVGPPKAVIREPVRRVPKADLRSEFGGKPRQPVRTAARATSRRNALALRGVLRFLRQVTNKAQGGRREAGASTRGPPRANRRDHTDGARMFCQAFGEVLSWPDRFGLTLEESQESGAHFGCGAPPDVPGGGTTFGSRAWGAGLSMAGSTSFGWMTPFDWFSFSLRFWAGAVGLARGAI